MQFWRHAVLASVYIRLTPLGRANKVVDLQQGSGSRIIPLGHNSLTARRLAIGSFDTRDVEGRIHQWQRY
jgi:hypothetical protein